jgi:hypothetical protein
MLGTAGHGLAAFGDYFARDRDLLLRTERALLTTSGFAPAVVEQNLLLAPKQFDVPRGSYRDLPLSGEGSFPVILYSRNAPAAVHQRCPGGESDSPRSRRRRSRTYGQRCPGAVRRLLSRGARAARREVGVARRQSGIRRHARSIGGRPSTPSSSSQIPSPPAAPSVRSRWV